MLGKNRSVADCDKSADWLMGVSHYQFVLNLRAASANLHRKEPPRGDSEGNARFARVLLKLPETVPCARNHWLLRMRLLILRR